MSRATEGAAADFSIIKTYGKRRRIEDGTCIFRRGDPVDRLYFLAKGRVLIEEVGVEISDGDIFGEIAFFTDAAQRTATARCGLPWARPDIGVTEDVDGDEVVVPAAVGPAAAGAG